jgi:hypothetical protein
MPGRMDTISSSLSFGAFNRMYLLRFDFFTALMRNKSFIEILQDILMLPEI